MSQSTTGQRLAAARVLAGYSTQSAAAIKLGVSRQQLSRWERGLPLKLESLVAVARLYDASLDWLLDHHPAPPRAASPQEFAVHLGA